MNNRSSLSILIVSCDRYADIWPHFFYLFGKYWPDCPYRVYLGSNEVGYESQDVISILVGKDTSWANSTKKMVENLQDDYFLFLLEDFFIRKPIDTGMIAYCLTVLKQLNGGYLRLRPFPKPDRRVSISPHIGRIDIGAPYRLALQAAIWRKDLFLQLVQPGETAWDMELKGSKRSDRFPAEFFCTWEHVIKYQAAITLGKWSPLGIRICEEEHMHIDFIKRPKMTREEIKKSKSNKNLNKLVNIIPWKIRKAMKRLVFPNSFDRVVIKK